MGLIAKVKNFFKKSDANVDAASDPFVFWRTGGVSNAFASIPAVYNAISFIALSALQAELGIFKFKDNSELYQDSAEAKQISALLKRPNPVMTGRDFIENLMGFLAYNNEFIIQIVKSRGQVAGTTNLPAQLWPVNPKLAKQNKDAAGNITSWTISGKTYPADEIIYSKFFNPDDLLRALDPKKPIRDILESSKAEMSFNKAYFKNNSTPPFALVTDQQLTADQVKEIQTAWNANHKGSVNYYKTAILTGGLKPTAISQSDPQGYIENSKYMEERILGSLKMQKALLNMTDTTNYATYMGQLKTFWEITIIPFLNKIEDVINERVVFPHNENILVRFKYDNVPAFKNDFKEKVETAQKLIQMGVPLNAVNDRLNLGFKPVAWGDDWWINFGLMPATDYTSDLGGGEDDAENADDDKKSFGAGKSNTLYDVTWKKFDFRQRRSERIFSQKIGRFFIEQRARILKANDAGELGSFSWQNENSEIIKMLLPAISDGVKAGANAAREQLNRKDFINDDLLTNRYLQKVSARIKDINQTTKRQVDKILTDAITQGASSEQTAENLKGVFGGFKTRARLIARTESTGSVNGGTNEYGKQLNATKTWITARDGEVRELHQEMEGETVNADEEFSNGMMYPGDPSGDNAEEVCNCRCTILLKPRG